MKALCIAVSGLLAALAIEAKADENPGVPPVICLDRTNLVLKIGETSRLTARIKGGAGNVLWASSNPGFATVAPDGTVVGVHEGSVTITGSLLDDPAEVECGVTVVNPATDAAKPVADAAASAGPRTITGIVIANEIPAMVVGDELGIVATCLPYGVFESNPYTLETSNSNVLRVSRANIVTAVSPGQVTLTARTPNGLGDSLTFEVKPLPLEEVPAPEATYQVELPRFGIVSGTVDGEQARRNTTGINSVLLYAQRWGYRSVVFPRELYLLDPAEPISMRSNLRVDLNGSTWQIMPNPYPRYALICFKEMDGPNLFKGYDVSSQAVTRRSLSSTAVSRMVLHAGDTNVVSLPIPVGAWPDRNANDQVVRLLERGSFCLIDTPIGVNKMAAGTNAKDDVVRELEEATAPVEAGSGKGGSGHKGAVDVQVKIGYYSNATCVATTNLGALWLKSTTAQLWCDRSRSPAVRLRPEEDYNNIRLELQCSLRNCEAEVFLGKGVVRHETAAVLHDCKLCNGTILGERDSKQELYPKWAQDGATEGAVSISFIEGSDNGIENLTVKKSIGFNIASGTGQGAHGAVAAGRVPLRFTDLEMGDLDEAGNNRESASLQRTKVFLDVSPFRESFELGLPLGYMGYNILRARVYDICFYDADKVFLEKRRGHLTYAKYLKPPKAVWAKIVLHWDAPITAGHPDFSPAIGFLTEFKPPIRNYIRNCVIEDNHSCGFAACGGINWRIEGNTFRRNGGRMPGCDIDWEDGWEYSQDDVVRSNSFESPVGLIVCSGINRVFRNNVHRGRLLVYGRSQAMKFEGNTFGTEGKVVATTFGSQTDSYICGNTFLGGPVRFDREHRDKARYKAIWLDNTVSTNVTVKRD